MITYCVRPREHNSSKLTLNRICIEQKLHREKDQGHLSVCSVNHVVVLQTEFCFYKI